MRSAEGISWWQPGHAPQNGWFWWDERGQCLREAEYFELLRLPLRSLQKGRVPILLADNLREGDWLKAWWDGVRGWAVGPCAGPSAPRREFCTLDPRRAVERGGGELVAATPTQQGWTVTWKRGPRTYVTQVDPRLNVLTAGFCLSGQDRLQDLTSLVSLLEGEESNDANLDLRGGHTRW